MEGLNQITLDRIIALVASVGACLSAIAAFLSVRQTIKQRKISYIPEIVIQPTSVMVEGLSRNKPPTNIIKNNYKNHESIISLHLENIGLGTAVSLEFKWKAPLKKMIDDINSFHKEKSDGISISLKNHGIDITIANESKAFYTFNGQDGKIDYVLPVNTEKTPRLLHLPNAYLNIYLYWIIVNLNKPSFEVLDGPDIPRLNLTYRDVDGTMFKRTYKLKIDTIMISLPNKDSEFDNNGVFKGYIIMEKI